MIDDNEGIEAAAERELEEETGYKASSYENIGYVYMEPTSNRARVHMVIARGAIKNGIQNLEPTEDITVKIMPVDDFKKTLFSGQIKGGLMVGASFLALHHIEKGNDKRQHV